MAKPPRITGQQTLVKRVTEAVEAEIGRKLQNDPRFQEALISAAFDGRKKRQLEELAHKAWRGLLDSLIRVISGFSPADNPDPSMTLLVVGSSGGLESLSGTPSTLLGQAWKPLAQDTLLTKMGKRGGSRFHYKIWRHRARGYSMSGELIPALRRARAMPVDLYRIPGRPVVRGKRQISYQYFLTLPRIEGTSDDALLNTLILASFIDARRYLPGLSSVGVRNSLSDLRFPERSRPLLSPLAARAGQRFRAQLKRAFV